MATKKDAVPMEPEMAIIIKTDAQLGTIDDNFDELKVAVAKKVMKYQGLVFADDDIKEAKSTKAELKKMIDTIEDNRKAIKRKWNDPYVAFEAKVKEVIALIEKPMLAIDVQIKDFEERRKTEKEAEVRAAIEYQLSTILGEKQTFIRQAGIAWDDRWLNATMSMTQVGFDISTQISRMIRDINSIQDICEGDDMLPTLLAEYQVTKDLAGTLQKRKTLLAQREAVKKMQEEEEARKKAEEEARAAAEAIRIESLRVEAELNAQKNIEIAENEAEEEQEEPIEDEHLVIHAGWQETAENELPKALAPAPAHSSVFKVLFAVEGDFATMAMLVSFLRDNKIAFEKISQEKIA